MPAASASPTAFTTRHTTAVPSASASLTIRRPSPHIPSPPGGNAKDRVAGAVFPSCWSWPTQAAATVAVPGPGRPNCSFLALLLRKELEDRLARKEWKLEWADVIRDLDNLIAMEVAISGKGYVFRGQTSGVAGKVFQACGVALPPALRPC